MIDVNQQSTPQGRPVKDGDMTVWARQMEDGSVAVALYNEDDTAIQASVDFSALGNGWTSSTAATVRDLWEFKDLGTFTGTYPAAGANVTVAPHAAIVLRMTKA
jgi:alpha-galactosidase